MNKRNTLQFSSVIVLLVMLGLVLGSCNKTTEHTAKYHCPMHPTYIADKPGDCPICGMRLVLLEKMTAPTTVPTFSCPMHPAVKSDKPGRCPECGMKLVPTGNAATTTSGEVASPAVDHTNKPDLPPGERRILAYRNPMDPTLTSPVPMKDSMGMDYVPVFAEPETGTLTTGIPGNATIKITSEGQRLAGVQTAPVVKERLARSLRTVGSVTADETRIRHVHTKIPGWVEKLFVNFTGQLVHKGQPILSIYSQELVASQEEYLKVRETAARFASSELAEVRKGGEDLVKAARRRLELFDVPEAFIAELERSEKVQRTVTLDAPVSGFVTVKNVFEGQQIEPAMELFTISDLSRIWIEADFYESDVRALRLGEQATVDLPYDSTTKLAGRIAFISPTLNSDTRTLKVRFEFPNPTMALKPGMFANIELTSQAIEGNVIPDSALMDTGERQVVFVSRGGGLFEPRVVTVGIRSGGKAEVLSGIREGEQVVVRANFLLDSESRLRAAISSAKDAATPTSSPRPTEPPPLAPVKPAPGSTPPPVHSMGR